MQKRVPKELICRVAKRALKEIHFETYYYYK